MVLNVDLIDKVEKKEITIPESNRELRRITDIFQQLKTQLQSYRVEKWNNVFLLSDCFLGSKTFAAVDFFCSPKDPERVYNTEPQPLQLPIFIGR